MSFDRKNKISKIVAVICVTWLLVIFMLRFDQNVKIVKNPKFMTDTLNTKVKNLKTILYYNTFFGQKDFLFGFGQEPFLINNCTFTNCFATDDKQLLASISKFDAIVFHLRNMGEIPDQRYRSPRQRYIMMNLESPPNSGTALEKSSKYFNWTMTYRRDSDILASYGSVQPIFDTKDGLSYPMGNEKIIKEIAEKIQNQNREKKVAWLVSHCQTQSKREDYVNLLSKFIPVDIYGSCGSLKCDKDIGEECLKRFEAEYKFYLSFENSICKDYLTEKVWKILEYDLVPVVLGGADYSQFLPKKSYIDALKFSSPESLANYLHYLDRNVTAYAEYFEWKNYFRVYQLYNFGQPFCQLCQMLNQDLPPKIYDDIDAWWKEEGNCIDKTQSGWSK